MSIRISQLLSYLLGAQHQVHKEIIVNNVTFNFTVTWNSHIYYEKIDNVLSCNKIPVPNILKVFTQTLESNAVTTLGTYSHKLTVICKWCLS